MDYKKFHRTNVIIQHIGCVIAAAWAATDLFIADVYASAPIMPLCIAYIITAVRIIALTGRKDYAQESYTESQKSFYTDNRRLYIFSAIFGCIALVLVVIKMIIR